MSSGTAAAAAATTASSKSLPSQSHTTNGTGATSDELVPAAMSTSALEAKLKELREKSNKHSQLLTAKLASSQSGQNLLHIGTSLSTLPPDLHSLLTQLHPVLSSAETTEKVHHENLAKLVECGNAIRQEQRRVIYTEGAADLYEDLVAAEHVVQMDIKTREQERRQRQQQQQHHHGSNNMTTSSGSVASKSTAASSSRRQYSFDSVSHNDDGNDDDEGDNDDHRDEDDDRKRREEKASAGTFTKVIGYPLVQLGEETEKSIYLIFLIMTSCPLSPIFFLSYHRQIRSCFVLRTLCTDDADSCEGFTSKYRSCCCIDCQQSFWIDVITSPPETK